MLNVTFNIDFLN